MTKKIAIIGASYLQQPLILKAKEMGLETHVFAWAAGDVGEKSADFFYPISIVEKDEILEKCRDIKIDGICTIASDLAAITVNYVAANMGLPGNTLECTEISTNKHLMRKAFEKNGDPSPKSLLVDSLDDIDISQLSFPIIVKPTDRSGSRGITKLTTKDGLKEAIENAKNQGFEKKALVEEFVSGQEYSVEFISFRGKHKFLAITQKFTTGAPHFIETAHMEPSNLTNEMVIKVKEVVEHALTSLKIENGASHSELKIDKNGNIRLIEIGGRMGGDFIGSDLVALSTGFDFVKGVIDVAMGNEPEVEFDNKQKCAAVRFIFTEKDLEVFDNLKNNNPKYLVRSEIAEDVKQHLSDNVVDSSTRHGAFLMQADMREELFKYMPNSSGE